MSADIARLLKDQPDLFINCIQDGQSWETRGLRGILTLRVLVLSGRWHATWDTYAAAHRSEVRALT